MLNKLIHLLSILFINYRNNNEMEVILKNEDAKIPLRGSEEAAGFDLFSYY